MAKFKAGDHVTYEGLENDPQARGRISRSKGRGSYTIKWDDDGSEDTVYDDDHLVKLTDEEINNSVDSILREHSVGLDYLEDEEEAEELTSAKKRATRVRRKHRKGLDYLRDK